MRGRVREIEDLPSSPRSWTGRRPRRCNPRLYGGLLARSRKRPTRNCRTWRKIQIEAGGLVVRQRIRSSKPVSRDAGEERRSRNIDVGGDDDPRGQQRTIPSRPCLVVERRTISSCWASCASPRAG